MTEIRIHKYQANSLVDGPGERAVLFMQGCPIYCPGCQNTHLWDHGGGHLETVKEAARQLADLAGEAGQVTISGGEPFAQPRALAALLRELRVTYHVRNIIVYTGFTWEQLTDPENWPLDVHWSILAAISRINVLVDGPFIKQLDDPYITYRGSRNQRPIDVQATLQDQTGSLEVLDWESPEIAITPAGDVILPVGLAKDFEDLGAKGKSRMCGQTKGLGA